MPVKLQESLKESLQDIEVILNYLSDPNNLSDSDGEHVRAILAKTGHQKVVHVQDLLEADETG